MFAALDQFLNPNHDLDRKDEVPRRVLIGPFSSYIHDYAYGMTMVYCSNDIGPDEAATDSPN